MRLSTITFLAILQVKFNFQHIFSSFWHNWKYGLLASLFDKHEPEVINKHHDDFPLSRFQSTRTADELNGHWTQYTLDFCCYCCGGVWVCGGKIIANITTTTFESCWAEAGHQQPQPGFKLWGPNAYFVPQGAAMHHPPPHHHHHPPPPPPPPPPAAAVTGVTQNGTVYYHHHHQAPVRPLWSLRVWPDCGSSHCTKSYSTVSSLSNEIWGRKLWHLHPAAQTSYFALGLFCLEEENRTVGVWLMKWRE